MNAWKERRTANMRNEPIHQAAFNRDMTFLSSAVSINEMMDAHDLLNRQAEQKWELVQREETLIKRLTELQATVFKDAQEGALKDVLLEVGRHTLNEQIGITARTVEVTQLEDMLTNVYQQFTSRGEETRIERDTLAAAVADGTRRVDAIRARLAKRLHERDAQPPPAARYTAPSSAAWRPADNDFTSRLRIIEGSLEDTEAFYEPPSKKAAPYPIAAPPTRAEAKTAEAILHGTHTGLTIQSSLGADTAVLPPDPICETTYWVDKQALETFAVEDQDLESDEPESTKSSTRQRQRHTRVALVKPEPVDEDEDDYDDDATVLDSDRGDPEGEDGIKEEAEEEEEEEEEVVVTRRKKKNKGEQWGADVDEGEEDDPGDGEEDGEEEEEEGSLSGSGVGGSTLSSRRADLRKGVPKWDSKWKAITRRRIIESDSESEKEEPTAKTQTVPAKNVSTKAPAQAAAAVAAKKVKAPTQPLRTPPVKKAAPLPKTTATRRAKGAPSSSLRPPGNQKLPEGCRYNPELRLVIARDSRTYAMVVPTKVRLMMHNMLTNLKIINIPFEDCMDPLGYEPSSVSTWIENTINQCVESRLASSANFVHVFKLDFRCSCNAMFCHRVTFSTGVPSTILDYLHERYRCSKCGADRSPGDIRMVGFEHPTVHPPPIWQLSLRPPQVDRTVPMAITVNTTADTVPHYALAAVWGVIGNTDRVYYTAIRLGHSSRWKLTCGDNSPFVLDANDPSAPTHPLIAFTTETLQISNLEAKICGATYRFLAMSKSPQTFVANNSGSVSLIGGKLARAATESSFLPIIHPMRTSSSSDSSSDTIAAD